LKPLQEDSQLIGALRGDRFAEGQSSYHTSGLQSSQHATQFRTQKPDTYGSMQTNLKSLQDKIKDLEIKLSGVSGEKAASFLSKKSSPPGILKR
jgi:hypothetical protein